ncbi:hypothetical protein ACFYPT_38920 [Streptomyces sp. NPDC005529]|uniref:hypothetical protein n=1 Tax=unclassified Streptomyces TaxID=2593676 RepID=UPI0033BE4B15
MVMNLIRWFRDRECPADEMAGSTMTDPRLTPEEEAEIWRQLDEARPRSDAAIERDLGPVDDDDTGPDEDDDR